MSNIFRPLDTKTPLLFGCRCGKHATQSACDADTSAIAHKTVASKSECVQTDFIEAAAIKAVLPHEPTRRKFLSTVGKSAALAAIGSIIPFAALQEAAAIDKLRPEKTTLNIGFLPILCATPLIAADPLGLYAEQGIRVNLLKRAGWALVRDQMMNLELDATHFLAPMPLAISLGVGSAKQDMKVACIQNTNGQALVMALKHKNNKNPKNWKGLSFAIPFEHSIHNYLLRYFLAEHGLDPDRDVSLRLTTPPDMIANLKAGNIDGFFGPEPFNQRAVWDKAGYIHTLSRDIWNGHPCCSFGSSAQFIKQHPQSFLAMLRAIIKSNVMVNDTKIRRDLAHILATPNYLNQPELVLRQSLLGRFADGDGRIIDAPDRMNFDALPYHSTAIWMLTQMKRWGYLKEHINYQDIAEKVFLLTGVQQQMRTLGLTHNMNDNKLQQNISIMGKTFDPTNATEYEKSFAISRL